MNGRSTLPLECKGIIIRILQQVLEQFINVCYLC